MLSCHPLTIPNKRMVMWDSTILLCQRILNCPRHEFIKIMRILVRLMIGQIHDGRNLLLLYHALRSDVQCVRRGQCRNSVHATLSPLPLVSRCIHACMYRVLSICLFQPLWNQTNSAHGRYMYLVDLVHDLFHLELLIRFSSVSLSYLKLCSFHNWGISSFFFEFMSLNIVWNKF